MAGSRVRGVLAAGALLATGVLGAGCEREPAAGAPPPRAAAPPPRAAAAPTSPAGAPATPGAPAAPRAVRVVAAAEVPVARTVTGTGTLAADEQVVLGAKVTGRLAEVSVDLGTPVRAGQAIGRVDPADYQYRVDQAVAALQQARVRLGLPVDGTDDRVDPAETAVVRQAKAGLDQAVLSRDRLARLWEGQFVARAELDNAVSALQVAESRYQDALEEVQNRQAVLLQRRSELALARQQLADTLLVSPIDGAVVLRQASVGEYLAAGAPVVTLVRLHPLRLRLAVPEREAITIRRGQGVGVTVEGDPTVHPGTVARLSPAISEQNRTLLIEAEIPNQRGALRPGAFARAEIVIQQDDRTVAVPAAAIVSFAGVDKVLTVKDGKSEERRVTIGRQLGDRVEIVSGLKAGEPVVVPPGNLTGGQPVRVEP